MAKKSYLELGWPVGGIDRSVGYQNQPPYTTPDALNVRTDDMRQYRERGGSRPGLGKAIRTQLPGPIRLLTKVSVLKATSNYRYQPYVGSQLRDLAQNVTWSPTPTYNPGTFGLSGQSAWLSGTIWGKTLNPVTQPVYSPTHIYEISVHVKPRLGATMNGQVKIHIGMAASTTDPAVDATTVALILTPTNYHVEMTERQTNITVNTWTGATFTDSPNAPGVFTVRVNPVNRLITVFWKHQTMLNQITGHLAGRFSAVSVVDANPTTLETTNLSQDFTQDTTLAQVDKGQRRDILVAVSEGQIWIEETANALRVVPVGITLTPDVELSAVDREQKLYIADFGVAASGTGATVASPAFNTLTHATNFPALGITTNFVLEIVDSNYSQNEKQQVQVFNGTAGTFTLSFRGATTAPIAYNAATSAVDTALEALSTIDTVTVTGSAGNYVIEFTGALAGQNLEPLTGNSANLTGQLVINDVQQGAGGKAVAGTYALTTVNNGSVVFDPALPVAAGFASTVGAIQWRIVKPPKIFDPEAETLTIHTATLGKGTVPAGCRLVALYRDRIVYAGSDFLPHVWFMSRQGDPNDWDYSQEDAGAATFAQASVGGQLAEPITALIPHGDDCLVVGCYNSLWIIRGDPGYGGSMDQLSRKIGIVGAHAWCRTPDDMICFVSPDGLYVMPAGCAGFPTSLSRERLPYELLCLDPERELVTLEYDTLHRGVHVFVTKHDGSEASHWWFDWEAKAWWRVKLQTSHEPFSLHEKLSWGTCPIVLLGGRDGYIRYFSGDFEVDDGDNVIESYCMLGPFHLDRGGFTEGQLTELTATAAVESGPITAEIQVANSCEQATLASARESYSITKVGLNNTARPRARGVACVVKLKYGTNNRRWFLERLTAVIKGAGRRRVRS